MIPALWPQTHLLCQPISRGLLINLPGPPMALCRAVVQCVAGGTAPMHVIQMYIAVIPLLTIDRNINDNNNTKFAQFPLSHPITNFGEIVDP